MSCCGKSRMTAAQATSNQIHATAASEPHYFEYVGRANLTARGPSTGRVYRFAGHGAVVAVDAYDSAAMAGVPGLRRVSRIPGR